MTMGLGLGKMGEADKEMRWRDFGLRNYFKNLNTDIILEE
jgi:hypothetical protein